MALRHPAADADLVRELVHRVDVIEVRRDALAHPAAPSDLVDTCRQVAVKSRGNITGEFTRDFFIHLHPGGKRQKHQPITRTRLPYIPWTERLSTVLGPEAEGRHDLLNALAEDANVVIRAAAIARLRGEYQPGDIFRADFAD